MASIGNLVVNMTAKTDKFRKGMTGAQSRLKRFGATAKKVMGAGLAVGAGVAAAGIAGMVRQMGALDKTAKLAARSGFSAETIAGMGFAAEQTGSDVGAMNKAFDKFSRSIGEATEGTGAASDALGMIGLNIEDLMGMNPDQRLMAVSDAIAGLEDPSLKAMAAADLFGRSGTELVNVLGMGSEGIKQFQAEADRLGLGFDAAELAKVEEANDAINRIKRSIGGMFGSMAIEFAPAIKGISDGLLTMSANFKATFGPIKDFAIGTFRTVQDAIADVGIVIGVLSADIGPAFEGMFKDVPKFAGAAFDWVRENAVTMMDNLVEMAKAFPGILDSIGRNLGEEFAFAVGLSDEKLQFDPLREFRTKKLTAFKMPEFSPETKGVLDDIGGALNEAKRQREAARAGVDAAKATLDIPQLEAFDPEGVGNAIADAAKEGQRSIAASQQRGSVEALTTILKAQQGDKKTPQVIEQQKTNGILRGMAAVLERQKERDTLIQERIA